MNTSRPFSADRSKLAYAQVFTRTSAAHHGLAADTAGAQHHATLRGFTARLHRPVKPTR